MLNEPIAKAIMVMGILRPMPTRSLTFFLWAATMMAPAQKKWAREAFPDFYTQRQQLLKKQGENVVKLAGLKVLLF